MPEIVELGAFVDLFENTPARTTRAKPTNNLPKKLFDIAKPEIVQKNYG
jgi:hypothetical protein